MHSPISAAPTPPQPLLRRQPTFRGQQAGETVVALHRGAVAALLLPGWPWLLSAALLGGGLLWQASGGLPAPVAATLSVPLALVTLVALLHWAVTHAAPWWFRLAIVTDQRVILSQGIIRSVMAEIPLTAVQTVEVVRPNLGETLLGYGRIRVAGGGGPPMLFEQMARPGTFADAINAAQRTHAPPAPTVPDATLQGMIERMGQGETLPTLPEIDPRLTVAWPLRRALALHLAPGEMLLGSISRHWWVLLSRSNAPLALLAAGGLAALVGAWVHATTWPLALALGGAGALWGLLVYLNFVDDAFIFTTHRIVRVQRRYFFLASERDIITYDKIQASEVISPGVLAKLLHFGTVQIAVSGDNPPLRLDVVPRPAVVFATVERIRLLAQKRAGVATANRERTEIKEWFAEVLTEMIVTTPELRGHPLEEALVRTYGEGMRLVVLGDTVVLPGYPPGIVISQSPSAGSRALRGGDISVMLSRTEISASPSSARR